jgi:hypothetical protein
VIEVVWTVSLPNEVGVEAEEEGAGTFFLTVLSAL